MKLGLGLYRHMLNEDNFRFAAQAGATHLVAHLVHYFSDGKIPAAQGTGSGWGQPTGTGWSYDELVDLKRAVNASGLQLEAVENLDPLHWHDILLDGPKRAQQIEHLKRIIRDVGRAGIPTIGYNFSLAGVWGHSLVPLARGGAESLAYLGREGPREAPIPNGMVWNMVYDPAAPSGFMPTVEREELWQRFERFLNDVLPVAEEAGVRLAAHPDDPPMPSLRGTPRLMHTAAEYEKVLDLSPSPHNCLELCIGTLAEMPGSDIYEVVDHLSRRNRIGYIHFRNVQGKAPRYVEAFVDDGDTDMIQLLRILKRNDYQGVLIPDHTPRMTCDAPWHAGMAFAMGYLRAGLRLINDGAGGAEAARID